MRLVVQRGISIANQHSLSPDGVVLVGGVALNCPANSQISRELNIPIWIPPACNDEGLAIGSAALAMQEATGLWVKAMHSPSQALIGNSFTTEHQDRVFSQHFQRITTSDKFATAAKLLDAGRIGCTFFGRSEVGPRALGNRSIIADARSDSTWMEVNRRKGREVWRPLAPIVLSDEFGRFFDGGPSNSWFMLFTHRVVSNDLPAITHRDFSARAQACNSENGDIFKLLNIFYSVTGCPVLLNTSFNGPGVPIVESPEMAAKEMMKLGLDFIICDAGIYIPRCPKS
jgi:carbamoyltransferase